MSLNAQRCFCFPYNPTKIPSLELTGLLWIHHPFISCCHAEWKKDTRELSQTHTHTLLLVRGLQSSGSLNLHWGLPLVWTLRGYLQKADHPEPDVSTLPPPFTTSSAFHTIERDSLSPSKIHAGSTLEHTQIPTHTFVYLPETDIRGHAWDFCFTLYSLANLDTNSPRVTWSCVRNVHFPVVEMMLIHVNNWSTGSILDFCECQQLSRN